MHTKAKVKMEKSRKRRVEWTEKAIEHLLDLWEERLPQIRGTRRNSHIYNEMAAKITRLGFRTNAQEIANKIHNFKSKYNSEKYGVGLSGAPSSWKHYRKVHKILGLYSLHSTEMQEEESIACKNAEESIASKNAEESIGNKNSKESILSKNTEDMNSPVSSDPPSSPIFFQSIAELHRLGEIQKEDMQMKKEVDDKLIALEERRTLAIEKQTKSFQNMENAIVEYLKK